MTPNLVSVIIPAYNRPGYLKQAVESVLDQTYPFIEILILDDGSPLGSDVMKKALEPYLSLPFLTYHFQSNRGLGATTNRGLSLARGEYIQRLDDDDRLLPEKLAKSVAVFQANPAVGMVATGYYAIDADGKRFYTGKPHPCPNPARLLNLLIRGVSVQSAVMVRASVHQKVGGYPENLWTGDYAVWIKIAREFEIETLDDPLVEYRRHSGNLTCPKNQSRWEREAIDILSEALDATPLLALVPNLVNEAYAYALRAALYLLRDGDFVRSVDWARAELETALSLSPDDPLLRLWQGLLTLYDPALAGCSDSLLHKSADQPKAEKLANLIRQRPRIAAMDPAKPEAVDFRRQVVQLRWELIQQTFKAARGELNTSP